MGKKNDRNSIGALRLLLLLVIVAVKPDAAAAIPVFARIYDKPCGACHTVYPQLNPAGEAFRSRGLHGLPPVVKPFKLGNLEVPGTLPVALGFGFGEDVTHTNPRGASTTREHLNLLFLTLFFGGELGPNLSFLGDYAPIVLKNSQTGEIDIQTRPGMAFAQGHSDFGGWSSNARVGLFELPLGSSPRVHRLPTRTPLVYAMTAFRLLGRSPRVTGGRVDTLLLSSTQIGAHLSTLDPETSLQIEGGAVTGSNNRIDNNGSADGFLRVGWEPGGHRAGLFFYYSPDIAGAGLRDKALRFGPDLTFYTRQWRLTTQFLAARDSNPSGTKEDLWYYGGFAEVNYRLTADWLALFRFDALDMLDFDDRDRGGSAHVHRVLFETSAGAQYLLRENLKLVAEASYTYNEERVSRNVTRGFTGTLRVLMAFWPFDPPLLGEWFGNDGTQ